MRYYSIKLLSGSLKGENMKKIKWLLSSLGIIFLVALLSACHLQEKFIFVPTTLPENYSFHFDDSFEELNIVNSKGISLNGLHFYAQNQEKSKGAILFLHGNADNIAQWGKFHRFYTQQGYDFFVFDYQGYGKSGGKIKNEQQLYNDIHLMVEHILQSFEKQQITIIGYSIGTGLAAESAYHFDIKNLVLVAPYFNFKQLVKEKAPFAPNFLLRYHIPTNKFLSDLLQKSENTKIMVIHGKRDNLIPVTHSQQLSNLFQEKIQVWQLDCCGHNDIMLHEDFYKIMAYYLR